MRITRSDTDKLVTAADTTEQVGRLACDEHVREYQMMNLGTQTSSDNAAVVSN